jgi:hypothetical protein
MDSLNQPAECHVYILDLNTLNDGVLQCDVHSRCITVSAWHNMEDDASSAAHHCLWLDQLLAVLW